MEKENKKEGSKPDFRGKLDVAAWINTDKNGKQYLSVKFATNVNLFKNEPKQEKVL